MAQAGAPTVQIVDPIDENHLATLKGNTHPLARAEFDRGRVSPDLAMGDLLLVLRRSPEQQAGFGTFVDGQYDPASPDYQQWLTAEEVGEKFGPAQSDVDILCNWLRSHGFSVEEVSGDRLSIRFSGTATMVENAFHTEIHNLDVRGEKHVANMGDPRIPVALAPVVVGVKALHNFFPRPLHRLGARVTRDRETGSWQRAASATPVGAGRGEAATGAGIHPQFGTADPYGNAIEDVTPYDFAKIYNVLPLWQAGTPMDGTGQSIAIAGTSNIVLADVAAFRSAFGLPAKAPAVIITNSDPGTCLSLADSCYSDLIENSLDVEWAGAVAKGAAIVLVTSSAPTATTDALYLSENYIVQHKTAAIMNVSYGECEAALGTAGNTGYNNLWQTAAAEGIAVFVASGDSGAAGCDQGYDAVDGVPYGAQFGLTVNGLASTPYDTAVGGTDFDWGSTVAPYWSSSNSSTTKANALGYIPEVAWNDTCVNPLVLPGLEGDASYLGISGVTDAESACNFVINQWSSIASNYGVDLAWLVDTVGGGGGVSNCTTIYGGSISSCSGGYAKPAWQAGVAGIPSDGKRDVPDVSFFASNGFLGSAYLICVSAGGSACTYSPASEPVAQEVGGTSVASPAMAGVMALINQKAGAAQGNPNSLLYTLAARQNYPGCSAESVKTSSSCFFNDINTGTNAVPCVNGSPACTVLYPADAAGILSGYSAGVGYDQATGLGSLNVANVVNIWPASTVPVVRLFPAGLTFASTPEGMKSASQTITLENTSKLALSLSGGGRGISIAGTSASSFTQTNTCGTSLAASSSCTISVTFKPAATGTLKAQVNVADNGWESPQAVSLGGTGTAPIPVVKLSATALSFGSTAVGKTNTAPAITLSNTGTAALSLSGTGMGISISGTNASSFSETNTCGASVAAGDSCKITVTFKPAATGALTAEVKIADNASGSPQKVSLSGTGTSAAVRPASDSLTHGGRAVAAEAAKARLVESYGKLPLRFEANYGQTDESVKFLSRGSGYGLYLRAQEAVLTLHKPVGGDHGSQSGPGGGDAKAEARSATDVVRMQLAGANGKAEPVGADLMPGTANYMLGNDPAQWHTNVPTFGKVRYAGIYPGVDLVYYGNQQQLEYDFVVAPGASAEPIRLHFAGARQVWLDGEGNLVIVAEDGRIAFHKPVVYQLVEGRRRPVAGRFRLLADSSAGFAVGRYDHAKALVIDPTLVYSTYLGGSGQDSVAAIAVDSSGAAYVTGSTSSTDFPVTPGAVQVVYKESTAFVSKLNPSGTALLYSTYLGGSGTSYGDSGTSIAVDSAGEATVTGSTYASNFPVTAGAFQTTNKAAANSAATGFVAKLNSSGTKLLYSTYLGGSETDTPYAVALDPAGDAFISGAAYSTNFPVTTGAYQSTNKSAAVYGWNDFVTKLNPTGSGLVFSTYLGGSGEFYGSGGDILVAAAKDASGDVFVSGSAFSTDFPVTTGAYQTSNKEAASQGSNLTLTKLNSTGTKLIYSTYLGGSGAGYHGDVANGLAVDKSGNAYLSGTTYESNFPVTTGAFQRTNKGAANGLSTCFVSKMNPAGTALVYSTYVGGSGFNYGDAAYGLALDGSGDVYFTGTTGSGDFPVTSNAFQTTNPAFYNGNSVFLTELNAAGTGLVYSTYMGGSTSFGDTGYQVALGSGGAVYLAGFTNATNFPVTGAAFQAGNNSRSDVTGFVAEFDLGTAATTKATQAALTSNANPAVTGTEMIFTATVAPVSGTGVPTGNVVFSIDEATAATVALNSAGVATYSRAPLALGQHYILASYAGSATYGSSGSGIIETITPARPTFNPPGGTYLAAQLVSLADTSAGVTLYYTTDGSTPTTASTKYTAPILVSVPETIAVTAVSPGLPDGAVASASYALVTAPTALAAAATAINTPNATLNGLVDTFGLTGSYFFQYGTSSTALTTSTAKTALSGSTLGSRVSFVPVPVSAAIAGLKTNTKYYYRVVVTTAAGTSSGEVLSFTTN